MSLPLTFFVLNLHNFCISQLFFLKFFFDIPSNDIFLKYDLKIFNASVLLKLYNFFEDTFFSWLKNTKKNQKNH